MLTSTTITPIYGKLSDLYGRKRVYILSMVLFLLGSLLCAQARSMEQLILFRAVQGLGAGGVLPLAFTIVGDLFTLEVRTKMQGLFSGIWGVSSVIGPLIGGFLVDQVSWHWVFYINLIPGLAAILLVSLSWKETRQPTPRVTIDYLGALVLTAAVLFLLLGLNDLSAAWGVAALVAAVALFVIFYRIERRAPDPVLPLTLFRDRLFTVAILHGILAGWAMFGSLNYVPLFVQAVLGTTATEAGIALTPMSLFWTLASIFGTRLLLKMSYRTLSIFGMVLLVVGSLLMITINDHSSQLTIMAYTSLMGVGMGLTIPAFLIAVQTSVPKESLGVATSTVQFSRSIGGTLGVSILGALLSSRLATHLMEAGMDPTTVSLDSLLSNVSGASAAMEGPLRQALAASMGNMFILACAAAVAALIAVAFTPEGKLTQIEPPAPVLEESSPAKEKAR
jgi:EmrB/QacA subfamily drug resistance transporter